jgi:hypothetical protein
MRVKRLDPQRLIPTDFPRSLWGILKFVPKLMRKEKIPPIIVVPVSKVPTGKPAPQKSQEFYICSGNHRAAAAYICQCSLPAYVAESRGDLRMISEGRVARCESIKELERNCRREADNGEYIKGRWEEYLRMITDSGVVDYEDPNDELPRIIEL